MCEELWGQRFRAKSPIQGTEGSVSGVKGSRTEVGDRVGTVVSLPPVDTGRLEGGLSTEEPVVLTLANPYGRSGSCPFNSPSQITYLLTYLPRERPGCQSRGPKCRVSNVSSDLDRELQRLGVKGPLMYTNELRVRGPPTLLFDCVFRTLISLQSEGP